MPRIHHQSPQPERSPDYRDLAVETLGDECAELREGVASLEADVAAYRAVLVEALAALHQVTRERDQLRRRLWELLDAERREAA
jgi:hypothetical protein